MTFHNKMVFHRYVILHFFIVCFCVVMGASDGFAQYTFDIPRGVTDLEEPEDDEEQGFLSENNDNEKESGSNRENSELSLSEDEIRELFHYGAALNFGSTSLPWQTLGLVGYDVSNPKWKRAIYFSYGKWGFRKDEENKSFSMNLFSNLIGFGVRNYFTNILPILYAQGSVGYAYWHGTVSPQSPEHQSQEVDPRTKLSTGFSSHGPILGISLGLATHWENGFYFEYTLGGVGIGYPLSETASQDVDEAKDFYKKELKKVMAWGITNVTLGYFFK